MRCFLAFIAITTFLLPQISRADVPSRRLSHYSHQRWIADSEAPSPITHMAQGRDGFLWLATADGLFRFDGITFERVDIKGGGTDFDAPSALLVTRAGDVWVCFRDSRRFAVYRNGELRFVSIPRAPERVVAMIEDGENSIWALTARHDAELIRLEADAWTRFNASSGLPLDDALSVLAAADGSIWVSLSNSVARLPPGELRFEAMLETPRANGRLAVDPDGRIWLSERQGSYPLTGPDGLGPPEFPRAPAATDGAEIRGAPMFDRQGNLWIATRYGGLQRVASLAPPEQPLGDGNAHIVEHFTTRQGLTSDVTHQLFEDSEGNIWIATERGLDKFRTATVKQEPLLASPAAFGDKLATGPDGSVYIGQSNAVYRVRPGAEPEAILRDVSEPQSICAALDGSIWIVFAATVVVWFDDEVRQVLDRPASKSTHALVYDCAFDRRGDFWMSAAGGGLQRLRDGNWEEMFGAVNEGEFYPTTMIRDGRGELLVQWRLNSLARINSPERSFMSLDFGDSEPQVLTLYAAPRGEIYAAGAFGVARYRGDQVDRFLHEQAVPRYRINGLVETVEGDIWVAYPRKLVRINALEWERAFSDGVVPRPEVEIGIGERLPSRPHSHSQRSLVQGGDGRIWLAAETGTHWFDPKDLQQNASPPALSIRAVNADGRDYINPSSLTLNPNTSRIEIDFAAISFSDSRRKGSLQA